MDIRFNKYQGTGNDFVILDNRNGEYVLSHAEIAFLCDRHFGIGADGLMLLELQDGYDFRMVYFNSDGNESSMCGNGGRCICAYANKLGLIGTETTFVAIDGPHSARLNEDGMISLKMADVEQIEFNEGYTILNTGSPHYVKRVGDVHAVDVLNEGKSIRDSKPFSKEGINVNFVQQSGTGLKVRTYERGVEQETLSCGTGVTAAAIASSGQSTGLFTIPIETPGGMLEVSFEKVGNTQAKNIFLTGPARFVFEGVISF